MFAIQVHTSPTRRRIKVKRLNFSRPKQNNTTFEEIRKNVNLKFPLLRMVQIWFHVLVPLHNFASLSVFKEFNVTKLDSLSISLQKKNDQRERTLPHASITWQIISKTATRRWETSPFIWKLKRFNLLTILTRTKQKVINIKMGFKQKNQIVCRLISRHLSKYKKTISKITPFTLFLSSDPWKVQASTIFAPKSPNT